MLNNTFKSLYFSLYKFSRRTVIITCLSVLLSSCSVTQQNESLNTQNLSPEVNKLYTAAVAVMKSGETKQAQILLHKVIEQQPNFSNAHVNLGILYLKMNMLEKAELSIQHAIRIDPNNIYAFNQSGFIYRTKGDFAKAKESYEKAINIKSDYAFAHLNLGILYDLYLYDLDKAVEQYKKYQDLTKNKDAQVSKWIFDLERRSTKSLTN